MSLPGFPANDNLSIRLTEKDRELLRLRAASPLRRPRTQHDVDGLDLFDRQRSPNLI